MDSAGSDHRQARCSIGDLKCATPSIAPSGNTSVQFEYSVPPLSFGWCVSPRTRPESVAGIMGVTFHDLRGTAVTRLALVGCTVPEIASITGHSLRDVHAIFDAHYLADDPGLAESAIRKLETGTKSPN